MLSERRAGTPLENLRVVGSIPTLTIISASSCKRFIGIATGLSVGVRLGGRSIIGPPKICRSTEVQRPRLLSDRYYPEAFVAEVNFDRSDRLGAPTEADQGNAGLIN
jgi:hypothetical protein